MSRIQDPEARAVEIGQQTSCISHMDALVYCYSPANQVGAYYMTGTIDGCQDVQSRFFKCLSLKLSKPTAEKERILLEVNEDDRAPPSASVWRIQRGPGATEAGKAAAAPAPPSSASP